MNRWARVTNIEDDSVLWINENHITCIKEYGTGCMVCFSSDPDEVVSLREYIDDIFAAWDDWQNIHKDG